MMSARLFEINQMNSESDSYDVGIDGGVLAVGILTAQASSTLFKQIVENSLNEVYVIDAHSLKFRSANGSALRNLSYTLEEIEQLRPFDIAPGTVEDQFRTMLIPLINRDAGELTFESLFERKNGSTYPVEVHLQFYPRESPPVYTAIVQDITERRRLHDVTTSLRTTPLHQRKQKDNTISQYSVSAAHEFKSLLSKFASNFGFHDTKVADSQLHGSVRKLSGRVHTKERESPLALTIEDDNHVLKVSAEQLASLGFNVLTAASVPEAIHILRCTPEIDIVFSDIVMAGGMYGIDVAHWVRQNRPHCRVVLTSGCREQIADEVEQSMQDSKLQNDSHETSDLLDAIRSTLKLPPARELAN